MPVIKHIWFDFSDTLASLTGEHAKLLHQTYAEAVGKSVSEQLITELEEMHEKYKSYTAVFADGLGLPSGYWAGKVTESNPSRFYSLKNPNIPHALETLHTKVPLSIFSNMAGMNVLLEGIGIHPDWFTHFLSSTDIARPKPALDGFYKVIELSNVPPENILFVGDNIEKEIIPAKKVGMQTALVWSESPEADYSFKSFEDILDIVKT
jgi:putative hydrolase of the HAD superfamily